MSKNVELQLVKYLSEAHAMEQQALRLLEEGADIAGDEEIARLYRAHARQTEEHIRCIAARLKAHGRSPSALEAVLQTGALGIGLVAQTAPDTSVRLATTAFALENFEIAVYQLIEGLARRAGDTETVAVVQRILDQEEAAALLVAGTFERTLEITLGEPTRSPLPPLTPGGSPATRPYPPREVEGEELQGHLGRRVDQPASARRHANRGGQTPLVASTRVIPHASGPPIPTS